MVQSGFEINAVGTCTVNRVLNSKRLKKNLRAPLVILNSNWCRQHEKKTILGVFLRASVFILLRIAHLRITIAFTNNFMDNSYLILATISGIVDDC